jgi:hypothetical protein
MLLAHSYETDNVSEVIYSFLHWPDANRVHALLLIDDWLLKR